nr:MAG TPA: hypothetical protein [Caudoviricetes sp.]
MQPANMHIAVMHQYRNVLPGVPVDISSFQQFPEQRVIHRPYSRFNLPPEVYQPVDFPVNFSGQVCGLRYGKAHGIRNIGTVGHTVAGGAHLRGPLYPPGFFLFQSVDAVVQPPVLQQPDLFLLIGHLYTLPVRLSCSSMRPTISNPAKSSTQWTICITALMRWRSWSCRSARIFKAS